MKSVILATISLALCYFAGVAALPVARGVAGRDSNTDGQPPWGIKTSNEESKRGQAPWGIKTSAEPQDGGDDDGQPPWGIKGSDESKDGDDDDGQPPWGIKSSDDPESDN